MSPTRRVIFSVLLALLPCIGPAPAGLTEEQDVEVTAAHLSGTAAAPIFEKADCTSSTNLTARYFGSVRSATGADIPNATGRLIFSGNTALLPAGTATTQVMSTGDLEAQASDGNQPSCVPGVNDGHPNDVGSSFLPSGPGLTWNMVVSAPGFVPTTIVLTATDNQGACVADADPNRAGCLISIGTITLQQIQTVLGRGVVAGTIVGSAGAQVDGATLALTDFSGIAHTRTSGTDCNGAAVPGTGFFCFSDSNPFADPFNDGLGLPLGPATLTMVNNSVANCGTGSAAAGSICGFLPASIALSVAPSSVTGTDFFVQSKFTPPTAPTTAAGAFGHVVNGAGQGIGGVTITATAPGQPTVVSAPSIPIVGLWTVSGLTPGVAYTFTISGLGLSADNVRPGLSIIRTAGPSGTWIDPSWLVVPSFLPGPGVTSTPTSTPLVSPTATPTRTPTIGPGLLGGRAFTLINTAPSQVALTWLGGTRQTGYTISRLTSVGVAVLASLPAGAISFADTVPTNVSVACYILQALIGTGVAAQSDVVCTIPRIASGNPPGAVAVQLNQGPVAIVGWTAPPGGGQTDYLFLPLATGRAQILPAGATGVTDNTVGVPTCYLVVARTAGTVLGIGDGVCGIPGLATVN